MPFSIVTLGHNDTVRYDAQQNNTQHSEKETILSYNNLDQLWIFTPSKHSQGKALSLQSACTSSHIQLYHWVSEPKPSCLAF